MPRAIDRNTDCYSTLAGQEKLSAERRNDALLSFLAASLGGGVLLLLPVEISGESIRAIGSIHSPAFFPVLGALLMCLVAILLAVRTVKSAPFPNAEPEGGSETEPEPVSLMRAAVMGTLILAYGVLVFVLGMVLASGLFILGAARVFGYTNPWGVRTLAVLVPVLVYLLFEKLLNVLLPSGWVF